MILRTVITLAAGILAVSLLSLASASHGFTPDRRMGPLHPSQGGTAYYTMCSSDATVRQYWAWGPESWEDAMNGAMYFENTSVDCTSFSNEIIQWEGYFTCGTSDWGCHFWSNMTSHDGHDHLNQGMIVWDQGAYNSNSAAERRALSAHEMGHGVGLADHGDDNCTTTTIMARIPDPPCVEVPTLYDALSAGVEHGYW